ncbi:MAG: cell surface protein SprA, partial [Chitinophagales bacterium]
MKQLKKIILLLSLCTCGFLAAQENDSTELIYPLEERQGDFISDEENNPIDLEDPAIIEKYVEYDPTTNSYILYEKIGDMNYRPPTYLTFDEYMEFTLNNDINSYWDSRNNTVDLLENSKNVLPPIDVNKKFINRLFGSYAIEIRPQGNVEVTLGGNVQKYDNPSLPERARKQGGFDFDMNINMNVTGKIGDKMQLTLKYNNQTGFAFDNQFKLAYTGEEDDIIQLIEAGNVSFPLETQLITGVQSLRGIKTQFKFGRLTMTNILAEQQSQKQSITVEDGAQTQQFEIKADQYEADKHFFLAQYFEESYDAALAELPNVLSLVTIEEIEVWVTNRTGNTQNVRDVVGLMDLAETSPYSPQITALGGSIPNNEANDLYQRLTADPSTRLVDNVVTSLQGPEFGLQAIQDYEKTFARLLSSSEYTLNPQLGYISLQSPLQPNQILAVAFKYTYNGQTYQVGELSRNVPPDSLSTTKT